MTDSDSLGISINVKRAMIELRIMKDSAKNKKPELPKLNITTKFLEELGRRCPTCSLLFADPHLMTSCAEQGVTCWDKCPVCFPEQYERSE